MDRHREWFDQGCPPQVHTFGDAVHLSGFYAHIFGKAAVRVYADDLQMLADVVLALGAGVAASAGQQLLRDDRVAQLKTLGTLPTDLHQFSDELVAGYQREHRRGMVAVKHMDIRAADTDVLHPYQRLAAFQLRTGDLS